MVGALLLAAVDDWSSQMERHPAHLRTELDALVRGTMIAGLAAAGTAVWMGTHGMHPPRHLAVAPFRWPAVSSRGKTYLEIHHRQAEPTNPRREAFCNQDAQTLDLLDDPTLCELTWEYDSTQRYITRIWITAPGLEWDPIEVPMAKVREQYVKWHKRGVRWLPGTREMQMASVQMIPAQINDDLQTDIVTRPRRGDGLDAM